MDDSSNLARTVAFTVAGYPIYLARTLIQIGYEPVGPDEFGSLPNIFSYMGYIRRERGYTALYTGLRYYLPAVIIKNTSYDLMVSITDHKKESNTSDISEIIAVCLRESALRIHTTILTYPFITLGIGYISSVFFGTKEVAEYSVEALYKGIVPKLILEVTMVWVGIISRRLTVGLIDDEIGQAIFARVPPFIVQSLMYPYNVVATVMADNGRSGVNPKFSTVADCFQYLREHNRLRSGSSIFYRSYQTVGGHSIKRYF